MFDCKVMSVKGGGRADGGGLFTEKIELIGWSEQRMLSGGNLDPPAHPGPPTSPATSLKEKQLE